MTPPSKLTVSLETAEANKALVRRWFEETDHGNLDIIDDLLPEDYRDHNPPLPDLPPGREGVRRSVMLLRSAFPDAVHTIEHQVAEGDKVMTRLTTRATLCGRMPGLSANRQGGPDLRNRRASRGRWTAGRTLGAYGHGRVHAPDRRGRRRPRLAVRHEPT